MKTTLASIAFVAFLSFTLPRTYGQYDMLNANLNFDAQMQAQLAAMQGQLAQSQQQFMQQVMADPNVQAGYQQHLASGGQASYAEYAYWYALTAGGTNIQGAIDAQRQQFEGLQQAHRTIQEGHQSYNDGWHENQVRLDRLYERMSTARRGEWYYTNPYTGETTTQPYTATPGYYNTPQGMLYIDQSGRHFIHSGGSWVEWHQQ